MSYEYYETDPIMKVYFDSLPKAVRDFIVQSGVEFSTLGELQQCAEHLRNNSGA